MDKLSHRIQNLSESATIAMSRRSREMREAGLDVISLSLGEPDFDTPDFIRTAAKQAIDEGYSHYPPVPGYQDLRQAIADKLKRDNNLDYTANQIVVSTGAKQSLMNVILCTINPGDEVLVPTPYWVSYYEQIRLAGGVPIKIPTALENDFKVTRADLDKYHSAKTKLLIFSSPCNPSGSVFNREDLAQIAGYLEDNPQVWAISDEIYELINFRGKHESLASFVAIKEQVITVNGFSKSYAMTGWRLGYIAAPTELAAACTKMQGQFTSATCGISQRAALAAIKADPEKATAKMREAFNERRHKVSEWLNEIPGIKSNMPEGAFYFFPEVNQLFGTKVNGREINNAADLCFYLLEEALVALVPGEAFGNPNCIRLSYASSMEDLEKALKRMKVAIKKLEYA